MSRILQALKQLEARPGESPAAPEGASSSPPPESSVGPAGLAEATPPVEPIPQQPPPRQVTERIAPRRKPQKARRAEAASAAEASSPESAATSAEDIERLLAVLTPRVVECWSERPATESVVVTPPQHDLLAVSDVAPTVVPEVASLTDFDTALPANPPALDEAETEITLEFATIQPRRAVPPDPAPQRPSEGRAAVEAIETQVRQAVRGPRGEAVTRSSAWETNIHADLDDAVRAAPIHELVARWRNDAAGRTTSALLVASLAQPQFAGEVAMRAAAQLARTTHHSVLLIDADPEGAVSRRLAIIGKPGLTELLAPDDAHGETIFPTATPRLHVLPRGRGIWPASADTAVTQRLLRELAHEYGWIIVVSGDTTSPAVGAFARVCDGTYVVAPLGDTNLEVAEQQLAALHAAGARIFGAIATE